MVIPEERDGKSESAIQLDRDTSKPSDVASTRQGGGSEGQNSRKVIVYLKDQYKLPYTKLTAI